jgi:uncharacterized protein
MPTANALMLEDALALLDWKRRVFALYASVRANTDPREAWQTWVDERDRLFGEHPQTPLGAAALADFDGLPYFDYDPSARVVGTLVPDPGGIEQLSTGGHAAIGFYRIARVGFELAGSAQSADVYWLDAYGGGLFLPFVDDTSGDETYGGGRYLLDTVKGADLGSTDEGLVLDFNFAYNPSCSYNERWICPLAPAKNRVAASVRAGERIPA